MSESVLVALIVAFPAMLTVLLGIIRVDLQRLDKRIDVLEAKINALLALHNPSVEELTENLPLVQ